MEFNVKITSDVLTAPWARSRRTVYAAITVGRTTCWVQRWDTQRAPNNRWRSRDGVMGWTWGRKVLIVPTQNLRIWTGPSMVEDIAQKFRDAGVRVTCVGTEHVHIEAEGYSGSTAFHNALAALYLKHGTDYGLQRYAAL